MDRLWIAVVAISAAAVVIIVAIVSSVLRTRAQIEARKKIALADAEHGRRYQELVELCVTGQKQTVEELAKLTERVAAIEKLLKDVG